MVEQIWVYIMNLIYSYGISMVLIFTNYGKVITMWSRYLYVYNVTVFTEIRDHWNKYWFNSQLLAYQSQSMIEVSSPDDCPS